MACQLNFFALINGTVFIRFFKTAAQLAPGRASASTVSDVFTGQTKCWRNYASLREILGKVSPDLDEWMVWEGYGKVLSRKGIPPVVRELCTCAALVVTGDDVQLHSHIRGAIHAGATPGMLRETIDLANGAATSKQRRKATLLIERILTKDGRDA